MSGKTTHIVKVTAIFTADVEVESTSADEAKDIATRSFGCVNPSWQCCDDRIRSWDAQVHPTKRVEIA